MSKPPRSRPRARKPAELMPRFQAKLIDWILVFVAIFVVTLVVSVNVADRLVGNLLSTVAGVLLLVGYFTLMESTTGRTLGKMALGLCVANLDGETPTVTQALKRNAYAAVPLIGIIPVLGELLSGVATLATYIFIAVTISADSPTYRGKHDVFGDTEVVRTR